MVKLRSSLLCICLSFVFFFVLVFAWLLGPVGSGSTVSAEWQEHMDLWRHLIDPQHVSVIAAGDLTGNGLQDIVVVHGLGSAQSLEALIREGDAFRLVSFDARSAEFLRPAHFAAIRSLSVVTGEIQAYLDYDIAELVPELSGVQSTLLTFRYLDDAVTLTQLTSTGIVGQTPEQRAHVFYDALKGEVFYRYLADTERVGDARSYYYRRYSRVAAGRLPYPITINASPDKWAFLGRSYGLQNVPLGAPINYGFNRWDDHKDLSAVYYAAWDDAAIYVLVEVTDDVFRQNLAGDALLRGDHIELWFGDDDDNRYQIALSPGNFADIAPESRLWFSGSRAVTNYPLPSITVASRRTSDGYCIEARIPVDVMGKTSVHQLTRFTLAVSDSDTADRQEKLLASSSLIWGQGRSLGEISWYDKLPSHGD